MSHFLFRLASLFRGHSSVGHYKFFQFVCFATKLGQQGLEIDVIQENYFEMFVFGYFFKPIDYYVQGHYLIGMFKLNANKFVLRVTSYEA